MELYHSELTPTSAKLVRGQQAHMSIVLDRYEILADGSIFIFTHKAKSIEERPIVHVSQNHSGQYLCNCKYYTQYHCVIIIDLLEVCYFCHQYFINEIYFINNKIESLPNNIFYRLSNLTLINPSR